MNFCQGLKCDGCRVARQRVPPSRSSLRLRTRTSFLPSIRASQTPLGPSFSHPDCGEVPKVQPATCSSATTELSWPKSDAIPLEDGVWRCSSSHGGLSLEMAFARCFQFRNSVRANCLLLPKHGWLKGKEGKRRRVVMEDGAALFIISGDQP